MELRLVLSADKVERELLIEVGDDGTIADVAAALGEHAGAGRAATLSRQGETLDPQASVHESGLRWGDRVGLAQPTGPATHRRKKATRGLELVVAGGPAVGTSHPLPTGTHVIGRSRSADIQIDDPYLSRRHLEVTVSGDDKVSLKDLGSGNGTFLDGRQVEEPMIIDDQVTVEAGGSLFRIGSPRAADGTLHAVHEGLILFNRPPRIRTSASRQQFRIPAPPDEGSKSRFSLTTILMPLLMGVSMLTLGGGGGASRAGGLAFVGVSLAMAGYSVVEQWLVSRKESGGKATAWLEKVKETAAQVEQARSLEMARRLTGEPDLPELIERAEKLRPELWEREVSDNDFLLLRLGWAPQAPDVDVQLEPGGLDELRTKAEEMLVGAGERPSLPLSANVADLGVVAMAGPPGELAALARSLVLQAATLHSPAQLAIAGLFSRPDEAWAWLGWLPHAAADTSPLEGQHVVAGEKQATAFLEELGGLIDKRQAERAAYGAGASRAAPAFLVVIDGDLKLPRSTLGRVLKSGPSAGVHVLWLGAAVRDLPAESNAIVEITSEELALTNTDTGHRTGGGTADGATVEVARRVALALAPVRDVAAGGGSGSVPSRVGLLELLDLDDPRPEEILARWEANGDHRGAPVGAGVAGPISLDMRTDGPHGLVGGTTGSGKSELLQSMVAALAVTHPPERMTFLLVDYKGGAAFKDCVNLPHTVGLVTDLDGHLVRRVLVSLSAELHHREVVLQQARAKDLVDMESRDPQRAPPTLLIVVDEFASLAKELPEFVDGVVNIAQRGRSLGMHLILATQRPAGVINDNIRANTNLRIALRVSDEHDSDDVIGVKDAAHIPRRLPGRGFVRTGHSELSELQSAYAGGRSGTGGERGSVEVRDLLFGGVPAPRPPKPQDDASSPTDLQRIVTVVQDSHESTGRPRPRVPWQAPLPTVVPLDSMPSVESDRCTVTLGVLDEPERQAQRPWSLDLEAAGSLLVYGTSGTGKTSALRTAAVQLATAYSPQEVHLYGLDFATRGLGSLAELPHCGAVVAGDDVPRVNRLMSMLRAAVDERKDRFARSGASNLSEYHRITGDVVPRIVVLLDGYGGFTSTFEKVDFGELLESFPRLLADGRALGVHAIMTAGRRAEVPSALAGVVSERLVLRMADDDEYSALGVDSRVAKETSLPAGRAWVDGEHEMQIALVGENPAGDAQAAAVAEIGQELRAEHPDVRVPPVQLLATEIPVASLPAPLAPLEAVVGIADHDLQPTSLTLEDAHFIVAGPLRSGRSTTLATIARSLAAGPGSVELHLLVPRRSPLLDLDLWTSTSRGVDACRDTITELENRVRDAAASGELASPVVLVIDDGEELSEVSGLETIAKRGRDVGFRIVGAAEVQAAQRSYGGWIPEVRKEKQGLLLTPDHDIDGDLLGVRLPRGGPSAYPPGRGYLVERGSLRLVQVGA